MPRLVWPKKDAKSAKVSGELTKSCDPEVSELENHVLRNQDGVIIYYDSGTFRTEISK